MYLVSPRSRYSVSRPCMTLRVFITLSTFPHQHAANIQQIPGYKKLCYKRIFRDAYTQTSRLSPSLHAKEGQFRTPQGKYSQAQAQARCCLTEVRARRRCGRSHVKFNPGEGRFAFPEGLGGACPLNGDSGRRFLPPALPSTHLHSAFQEQRMVGFFPALF